MKSVDAEYVTAAPQPAPWGHRRGRVSSTATRRPGPPRFGESNRCVVRIEVVCADALRQQAVAEYKEEPLRLQGLPLCLVRLPLRVVVLHLMHAGLSAERARQETARRAWAVNCAVARGDVG